MRASGTSKAARSNSAVGGYLRWFEAKLGLSAEAIYPRKARAFAVRHMKHFVHKHRDITIERVEKFISSEYWKECNLFSKLYRERSQLCCSVSVFSVENIHDRPALEDILGRGFLDTNVGTVFGPSWSTHWFKVDISIPAEWLGQEVHFLWDSESEAMIYEDGIPVQGLTGGGRDDRKEFVLSRALQTREQTRTLYIEMAANGMFGVGTGSDIGPPDPSRTFVLKTVEVAVFNRNVWDLWIDLQTVVGLAKSLPKDSPRAGEALWAANAMVNACFVESEESYDRASAIGQEVLRKTNAADGCEDHVVTAIGHCHIDTAWLWPYAETRRKIARSWSTQMLYMDMEENSDYKFAASQAVQYAWLKEDYPTLFSKVKTKHAAGQWIITGGTWVEMDCNVPSGESFVRQFLYGQRFFQEEFGQPCSVFWLPDTFGYSAQLPQIAKGAGCEFFLTQKLSWNTVNKFPHSTFMWEGLDGTRILSHFPPADSYVGNCSVEEAIKAVSNFKDHGRNNASMLVFGYGDGGGGPTPLMLARLRRLQDLRGVPPHRCESPEKFFERAARNAYRLCVWSGELYFEFHRGTYTTHASIKAGNRRCEFLLGEVELLHCLGGLAEYPQEAISRLWKLVLLNQFHDVLPGTSIPIAMEDARVIYHNVLEECQRLKVEGLTRLADRLNASHETSTGRKRRKLDVPGGEFVVLNSVDTDRVEVVSLPSGVSGQQKAFDGPQLALMKCDGMSLSPLAESMQRWPHEVCVRTVTVKVLEEVNPGAHVPEVVKSYMCSAVELENSRVKATILRDGRIFSLLDKTCCPHRQVIAKSTLSSSTLQYGNSFVVFEDLPPFWDAWDTMEYCAQKPCPSPYGQDSRDSGKLSIVEKGPLRAAIRVEVVLGRHSDTSKRSFLHQTISLSADSSMLEFHTDVCWHESHKFLKVEFPVGVRNPNASYEIQFGHLERPTHANTSWDMAKFEVCGHKWADLSEHGYGVALLNDAKYGYAIHGNIMRLSLLRSSKRPDPEADMGNHSFRYALLPHQSSLQEAGVIRRALAFNSPLTIHRTESLSLPAIHRFFKANPDNMVISAIKKAEDGPDVVVRVYEAYGSQVGAASLAFSSVLFPRDDEVPRAAICDLLERPLEALVVRTTRECPASPCYLVEFPLKPFQICTLRFSSRADQEEAFE